MDPSPISGLYSTTSANTAKTLNAFLGGGAGGDFTSVFESLLSASRANALSATDPRLSLIPAQSKLQQQTTLFNIFSGEYSTKSYGFGMLGGFSDVFSLPSWAYDVERVMGDDKISALLDLQRQMSLYTSGLLGKSDLGSFSSLI